MGIGVISLVFAIASAVIGYFLSPRIRMYLITRIVGCWVAAAAIGFLVPEKGVAFLLLSVLLGILAPTKSDERVIFFIGVFAALPSTFQYPIPFPGINFLIEIDFAKTAALIVLAPVLLMKRAHSSRQLVLAEHLLLSYCIVTGIMGFRDLPITSVLRVTFDQLVLVYLPIAAATRALTTKEQWLEAIKVLVLSAVLQMSIALVSFIKDWKFYTILDGGSMKTVVERRHGFLRASGTLSTSLLGYLVSVGAVGFLLLKRLKLEKWMKAFGVMSLLVFVVYLTGSRGGQLSALVTLMGFYALQRVGAAQRKLIIATGCVAMLSGFSVMLSPSFMIEDEFGSFQYRVDLLRTSLAQIAERPFFGSNTFLEQERFAALVQGEGIVDLVNSYIQIALFYGLVGLSLFLAPWLLATQKALFCLKNLDSKRLIDPVADEIYRGLALMLSVSAGFLVLMMTTSMTSYMWDYAILILALMIVKVRVALQYEASAEVSSLELSQPETGDEERVDDSSTATGFSPAPYGARFARRD